MRPSVAVCRRLLIRYSLVCLALCAYTAWIHIYVATTHLTTSDFEQLHDETAPDRANHVTHSDGNDVITTSRFTEQLTTAVPSTLSRNMYSEETDAITTTATMQSVNINTSILSNKEVAQTEGPQVTTAMLLPSLVRPEIIVHVTWFYPPRTLFRFHEAMCLLAVQRYVRPRKILFWYDAASTLPSGPWWQFARQSVAHLLPVPVDRPTSVYNRPVNVREHQSDLVRLDVLERYGGLYVDLDVIVVRPIDDLIQSALAGSDGHQTPVVMGAETPDMLGSGFILSQRPGAEFLTLWRQSYADGFDDTDWNRHSVFVPMELARKRPELVRIEWFSINRPNWNERRWLYTPGSLWDWSSNYAVHLWSRDHPRDVVYDPVTIRRLNTTTGEVLRHIYYEHTDIMPDFVPDFGGSINKQPDQHQMTSESTEQLTTAVPSTLS